MAPTPGQQIIGSTITGALAGWLFGRAKAGAAVGAVYGLWYTSVAKPPQRAQAPVNLATLVDQVNARLKAAGVTSGAVKVQGKQIIVTLPGIDVPAAQAAVGRDLVVSSKISQDPASDRANIHFDLGGAYGGPAFYVPGAGSGSQQGMWSYTRPGA